MTEKLPRYMLEAERAAHNAAIVVIQDLRKVNETAINSFRKIGFPEEHETLIQILRWHAVLSDRRQFHLDGADRADRQINPRTPEDDE